jgi:hypothetical protein
MLYRLALQHQGGVPMQNTALAHAPATRKDGGFATFLCFSCAVAA